MRPYNIDQIIEEYIKAAQQYYPSLRFGGRFSIYSGDEPPGGEISFGTDNNLLNNTPHSVGRKNLEIVHFTSLKAGLSIIENGELWLSQVEYCNDALELEHAFSTKPLEIRDKIVEFPQKLFLIPSQQL